MTKTDTTDRALALTAVALPSGEALAKAWSDAIVRSYGELITDVEALMRELRPDVARVIQEVIDEADSLKRDVEYWRKQYNRMNSYRDEWRKQAQQSGAKLHELRVTLSDVLTMLKDEDIHD